MRQRVLRKMAVDKKGALETSSHFFLVKPNFLNAGEKSTFSNPCVILTEQGTNTM